MGGNDPTTATLDDQRTAIRFGVLRGDVLSHEHAPAAPNGIAGAEGAELLVTSDYGGCR